MERTNRGGAGTGAALVVSALLAAGCGGPAAAPVALPATFPVQQVPVIGEIRKAETIEVGHPMWRVTVEGRDTVAAARALTLFGTEYLQREGDFSAQQRQHYPQLV